MKRLSDFVEVFLGRAPPKVTPGNPSVPRQVLALRDITVRITPPDSLETIETPPSSDALRLAAEGDIVITARGRLRAALVGPEHDGVVVGSNLILLRFTTDFPAPLLLAYLRHPETERRLLIESAGTATPGVSVEALRQLTVVMPSRELWSDAAELVTLVDVYHDELIESARLLKQGVSEWVYRRFTPSESPP